MAVIVSSHSPVWDVPLAHSSWFWPVRLGPSKPEVWYLVYFSMKLMQKYHLCLCWLSWVSHRNMMEHLNNMADTRLNRLPFCVLGTFSRVSGCCLMLLKHARLRQNYAKRYWLCQWESEESAVGSYRNMIEHVSIMVAHALAGSCIGSFFFHVSGYCLMLPSCY